MNLNNLQIFIGMEWELEYNKKYLSITANSYHSREEPEDDIAYFSDRIFAEEDGSLNTETFYNEIEDIYEGDTCELITEKIPISQYTDLLDEFKNTIIKESNKVKLSDVISFNNTTGAHLHFSIINKKTKAEIPIKIIPANLWLSFNETLFKKFETNFEPYKYAKFRAHYYRAYASKIIKSWDRRSTINLTLDEVNHLELRSFHLRHCTTWEDVYKSYHLLISTLQDFLETCIIKKKLKFNNKNTVPLYLTEVRPAKKEISIPIKKELIEVLNTI